MKIVCSSNMPFADQAFSTLGETVIKDGRVISAEDVRDADILAVRSTTKIDRDLLDGSTVRFAGTATIGTDHMDIPYLKEQGIQWCYAPGCNANSVSEYITSALLCLGDLHHFSLAGKVLGIIGVGNVGRRVARKAAALGMSVLRHDPPRERAGENEVFVSLEDLLTNSDIVSLHVPLTREGPDATYHLANADFFASMRPGSIFINSSRGNVLQTDALLAAMDAKTVAHAIVDVWEGEPGIREDLLRRVDLATPHIAGHSFEGKVMGTLMVYQEVCRFLDIEPVWTPDQELPEPAVPEIHFQEIPAGRGPDGLLWGIVRQVYNVQGDDRSLRSGPPGEARAGHFDSLRRNYPVRREFPATLVTLEGEAEELQNSVAGLGFRV